MAMQQLPTEVLEKILLFLPVTDRLNCAPVCLRWAEILSSFQLLDDVWMNVYGNQTRILNEARRKYTNLRIYKCDSSRMLRLLRPGVRQYLRRVMLVRCEAIPEAFLALARCPTLESLVIEDCALRLSRMPFGASPSSSATRGNGESVKPLCGIKHFATNEELSPETVEALLIILPNATSFRVPSCPGHSIVPLLSQTRRSFTDLSIWYGGLPDDTFMELIRICAHSLERLQLSNCWGLGPNACLTISRCSKLKHLEIQGAHSFDGNHMKELVSNAPQLVTLKLFVCGSLRDEALAHIHGFRRLQKLSLSGGRNLSLEAKCSLGRMISLQHLDLDESYLSEKLLGSMKDLKDLRVLADFPVVRTGGFAIICTSFERLTTLEICCTKLRDVDGQKLRMLKNLENLFLEDCKHLTDITFIAGIRPLGLRKLWISICRGLTGSGIACIDTRRGPLKELKIEKCDTIQDCDLEEILQRGNSLRSVHVSNCRSLSDKWIAVLPNCCSRLERLTADLSSLNDSSVRELTNRRPEVELDDAQDDPQDD